MRTTRRTSRVQSEDLIGLALLINANSRDRIIVVDSSSASPPLPGVTYYGIEATHSQMCKFDNPSAPGFRTVSTDLRAWSLEAPSIIADRWIIEDEDRAARVRHDIRERVSPYMSSVQRRSVSPQRPLTPTMHIHFGAQAGFSMHPPRTHVSGKCASAFPVHQRQQNVKANQLWPGWGADIYELEGDEDSRFGSRA